MKLLLGWAMSVASTTALAQQYPARPIRILIPLAEKLFVELNKALKVPIVRERQNAVGIEPTGSASRAAFVQFMRVDAERWRKIIRDAGVKVE